MGKQIPVLDLGGSPRISTPVISAGVGSALEEFGFVGLSNHGVSEHLITRCYTAARNFFALPERTKLRYFDPKGAGARGYSPFGKEKAKDRQIADLKEFWHVGREFTVPTATPVATPITQPTADLSLPANVWPSELANFRQPLLELYAALDELGADVLQLVARHLGLPPNFFADKVDRGNSILRLLHYPPLNPGLESVASGAAVRAAAHEDINLITLLVAAEGPGLEILSRGGEWLRAPSGSGIIVCNVGDMLQRLTNHVLPSTRHRVVNPPKPWSEQSRYSLPFFLHPNSEFLIETLPGCISADNPDRYPTPITADDYLRQRLVEIGLMAPPATTHD